MKTFLVSGAGSGIGRAIANKLAAEDQKVILLGRTDAKLKQTKGGLQNPDRHQIISADVRDRNAIGNGLKAAGLTQLDGVVANAGVGGENIYGPKDRWDEIISINLTGTYLLLNEWSSLFTEAAGAFQTYHYYIFHFSAPGDSKLLGLLCFKGRTAGLDALLGRAVRPGQNISQRNFSRLGRDRYGQRGDPGLCRCRQ